jgi:hypothetical protein
MPLGARQSKSCRREPAAAGARLIGRYEQDIGPGLMPRQHLIILVLAVCIAWATNPATARAGDNSALAFVTAIYSAYKGKDGIPLENGRVIRRYFEPQLAALMAKDQAGAAKRGEVGLLDFDPFLDAQDWDTSNFDIAVDAAGANPGKAKATVKFINQGEAMTVRVDLIQIQNDWRVFDITWQHDGKSETLRQIYVH